MISSAADPKDLQRLRRRIFLALFTALAVALHSLEALLPSPAPWFRVGFANILTLLALDLFGGQAAWGVALARIGIGSFLLGQFLSPGFFLALAGGVTATALMTGARAAAGRRLGPVGISSLGAFGHATGQMVAAWGILIRHPGVWHLFPFLLFFSILAGVVNGLIADVLLAHLRPHPSFSADAGEGG